MAIGVRSSGSATYNYASASQVVTIPAGTQPGDLMVVTWSDSSTGATLTPPTGWTAIGTTLTSTNGPFSVAFQACYRIAQPGDSTWTFTESGGSANDAITLQSFSGVSQTTPIDATGGSATGGSTIVAPSVTVVTAGAWEVIAWGQNATIGSGRTASGFTDLTSTTSPPTAGILWEPSPLGPGATGTVSTTGSTAGALISFALRPAPVLISGPLQPTTPVRWQPRQWWHSAPGIDLVGGLPPYSVLRPVSSPRRSQRGSVLLPRILPAQTAVAGPPAPWRPIIGAHPFRRGKVLLSEGPPQQAPPIQPHPWRSIIGGQPRRRGSVLQPGKLPPQPPPPPAPRPWRPITAPGQKHGGRAMVARALPPQSPPPPSPRPWSITSARQVRRPGRVWIPGGLTPPTAAPQVGLPPGLPVSSPRRPRAGAVLMPRFAPPGNPTPYTLPPPKLTKAIVRPRPGSVLLPRLLPPPALAAQTVFRGLTVRPPSAPLRPGRLWMPRPGSSTPTSFSLPWSVLRPTGSGRRSPPPAGWRWAPRLAPAPVQLGRFRGPMLVRRSGEDRARRRSGWLLHWLPIPLEGAVPLTGYHIYSNNGSGAINYNTPIATVYGLSWTSGPLAYPDTWRFGVRAFNTYGEEKNLDAAVTIILDGSGNDITLRPSPPIGLRAFATAGGGVRVEWAYPITGAEARATVPTGFHVYIGTGGVPSYGSPAATVLFTSGIAGTFVANLTGLTGGTTYYVGVRAYNAVAEEPNTAFVSVTADSTGPAPVDSLTATAI